jgi:hypothetical protein
MRRHYFNAKNATSLLDVLTRLEGIKADLTVRVSLEELGKLQPEQCKAFLEGVAAVVAVNAKVELETEP